MNRVAGGEDPEAVVSEIQADIEKMLAAEETASRGLYIIPENSWNGGRTSGARWVNGLIRYAYADGSSSIGDEGKQTAEKAMKKWTDGTGGEIRFEGISPNLWSLICRGIGQYQYVTISKKDLPNDTSGRSDIGSVGAFSSVEIDPVAITRERTYLHELGHTIGLLHEHQWSGRDSYINVSSGNAVDYGIIPEKSLVVALYPVRIWFITIYLPYIWYVNYSKHYGSGLDFNSIMLYDGLEIRPAYANSTNGKPDDWSHTRWNLDLSEYDKQTVKAMY
ncbi:MAG: hypothetical protein LBU18_07745 [Treponema sp.]|jgi:hypothetical protein|nr:hypothetical protein [Treponema sp.]